MFDVIWTDHNRELVGERRARKELDKETRKKGDTNSTRSSTSTGSSSSSRGDHRGLGFLGGINLRKSATPSKPKSVASSHKWDSGSNNVREHRDSLLLTPASSASDNKLQPIESTEGRIQLESLVDSFKTSPTRSSQGESMLSRWTEPTITTPPSSFGGSLRDSSNQSQFIQPLGPSSFIKKTTEVVVEPRTPNTTIDKLISDITITSDTINERPTTPVSPKELSASPPKPRHMGGSTWKATDTLSSGVLSPIPVSYRANRAIPAPNFFFRSDNADSWRPPSAWNCPPPAGASPPTIEEMITYAQDDEVTSMALDLAGMQREVKRMAAASPQIILVRLREEWGAAADAALYKELEMEKKRWMLSALYNMDRSQNTKVKVRSNNEKVLAFFETQATASYLAAVHVGVPVYHMSPGPLSHKLFPNIRPMLFPTVPTSSFPVAPNLFTTVYSLSLASLVPSTEIPPLLRNIYRILQPLGSMHLILIDPLPVQKSTGRRMQKWFDDHIQLNLQRHFRCTCPSQLFPAWLGDARLRGRGSSITKIKFLAVASPVEGEGVISDVQSCQSHKPETRDFKVELRSLVGRMLWKEVWGQFVTAEKWWWDDPDCVAECISKKTYWEYSMIEAVKEA